jgi:sterol desaturase/sphingolipid hydroxylase (fatty acid hydroxylase superfamily)
VPRSSSIAADGLLLAAALFLVPLAGWALIAASPQRIDEVIEAAGRGYGLYAAYAPFYVAFFAATLVWEWARPVVPSSIAWRGMRDDLLWVVVKPCLDAAVASAGIMAGLWLHYHLLGGATLGMARTWPVAAQIAVAFVAADLLLYLTHVARHHVPVLWRFHAVHHSQTRLNFFTEDRNHPIDVLLTRMPIVIIMRLLGVPPGLGFTMVMLTWWHGRFIHANVRCRFGPLRAILVTPQSHRIHHSCEPAHRDKNFGTHLAIWDRLFGTQHPDDRVYPATGIAGERPDVGRSSIASLGRELARPFDAPRS